MDVWITSCGAHAKGVPSKTASGLKGPRWRIPDVLVCSVALPFQTPENAVRAWGVDPAYQRIILAETTEFLAGLHVRLGWRTCLL